MIRGYVSSDEDDDDDYDFGYSEPLIIEKEKPNSLPEIQTPEIKEKLHSVLRESEKVELFLKAVTQNDLATAERFLSEGLSADSTDQQGWTPLMRACGDGSFEMVRLLLNYGADSNKHKELFTPLMTCCTYTLVAEDLKLNCVSLLLENGANINAKDKYRTTALMYAAGSGYETIVDKFLELPDIIINIQDKEGWTALFYAVNQNMLNIVKKLVSAKIDLKIRDKFDRTALNLALEKDFKDVAEVLGYVEEKFPESKHRQTLRDSLLKELPDSKGQGGFYEDSKAFFSAFDFNNVQNICFFDLLNATEDDLYKVGIRLHFDRLKLLSTGIHQYHLHPWKSSSMYQVSLGTVLSLEDIISVTASIAKHLTIANASLKYVDTRILSRKNSKTVNLSVEQETVIVLGNIYTSVEKLKLSLQKSIEKIEKIKPEIPGDYIFSHKCKEKEKKYKKVFWCTVGAAAAGFFIFYFKSNYHYKSLVRFSSYSFTSLLHLFHPESLHDTYDVYY